MLSTFLAAGTVQLDFAKQAAAQQVPGSKNLASADAGFGVWMGGLLSFIMIIAAVMVFVYLLWGGIEWITAGGDKGKIEAARNKITQAIIGIIVLASSVAIVSLVQRFLGFCFLRFGGAC